MKFVAPEMEVMYFSTDDVITASQTTTYETMTSMSGAADCPAELPMD